MRVCTWTFGLGVYCIIVYVECTVLLQPGVAARAERHGPCRTALARGRARGGGAALRARCAVSIVYMYTNRTANVSAAISPRRHHRSRQSPHTGRAPAAGRTAELSVGPIVYTRLRRFLVNGNIFCFMHIRQATVGYMYMYRRLRPTQRKASSSSSRAVEVTAQA